MAYLQPHGQHGLVPQYQKSIPIILKAEIVPAHLQIPYRQIGYEYGEPQGDEQPTKHQSCFVHYCFLFSLKKSFIASHSSLEISFQKVITQYQLADKKITVIGYSNGANLALNVLKEFEAVTFDHAFLFHPSTVRPEVAFKPQKELQVLITSGANDPYISEEAFEALCQSLADTNTKVDHYHHAYGHQLIREELDRAKTLLK